jgi:hypothetical protein
MGQTDETLDAAYAAMAADSAREAEAMKWIRAVLFDPDPEQGIGGEITP